MDVLFRGAMVFDGSGAQGLRADVLVRGSRVAAIGADATALGAASTIDADGLALAPGFIDMHSHADHTLPAFAQATNSITQGVTTEVVGLCGFSPAPVSFDTTRQGQLQDLARGIGPHLDWSWHSFDEYLNHFSAAKPAVNVVPL